MSSIAGVRRNRSGNFFRFSKIEPYFFIAPFLLLIIAFNLYTFYIGGKMAFTDAQGINMGEWIGLANFQRLLFDEPDFWPSIGRTFIYTFGCLVTQIPAAFLLAVLLNSAIFGKARGFFRASFYVPVLMNAVVASLLFRMLFNKDTGLINWILGALRLPNDIDWVFNPSLTMWLMIAVSFWQWVGYHMVYLLASLQSIDPTIYEVAKLDGASTFRTMFQITIPLLRPAFTFVMIMSAIGGMQQFAYSYMLFPNAGYGPGLKALTGVPFIYRIGFSQNFEFGYATAAGWLLFLFILIISIFQLRFFGLGQADEI